MLSLYTNLMIRLRSEEKGATAVEYGIMVALIAVVIIVAVSLLGGTLTTMFEQVRCQVGEELIDKIARAGDGSGIPENSVVRVEDVLGEIVIVRKP